MITIGAIHSGATSLAPVLEKVLTLEFPEFKLINIIDDSLIATVIREGKVSSRTVKRVVNLAEALLLAGADVVVDTCSSVGEAAEVADRMLDKPIQRIDQAMINLAVRQYSRIGVLASLSTTLEPTVDCVYRTARRMNKKVEVQSCVAEGAFEKWVSGKPEAHDDLLVKAAQSLEKVDVLLLAQVSMMRVQDRMTRETGKTVLSSPAPWAEALRVQFPDR